MSPGVELETAGLSSFKEVFEQIESDKVRMSLSITPVSSEIHNKLILIAFVRSIWGCCP